MAVVKERTGQPFPISRPQLLNILRVTALLFSEQSQE